MKQNYINIDVLFPLVGWYIVVYKYQYQSTSIKGPVQIYWALNISTSWICSHLLAVEALTHCVDLHAPTWYMADIYKHKCTCHRVIL